MSTGSILRDAGQRVMHILARGETLDEPDWGVTWRRINKSTKRVEKPAKGKTEDDEEKGAAAEEDGEEGTRG